ncbi:Uncharacterized protein C2orf81 homolog [Geodia barretti]|uniref:Uncharacterized protein C2orf81 homolog n=1 Tax=Geodia barretti TaxID=519541 RepID=A0AA35W0G2_GEOBA|nr:Uncharacterized protein C2orf81 homolog [Geodia barretti]
MDSLVHSRKAASSMAQKGKKDKGSGGAAAAEVPPERDVIPGKITESQWQEWLEGEESSEVAGEVVRGLVDLAFYLDRDHCLEEQAFSHTVQAARASLLQIIEWEFLQRDEGERDPGNDPSWLEDDEPECSVIDSWARGIVPEVRDLPEAKDEVTTTSTTSLDHQVPLPNERETSTTNSIPLRDNSRQPTRESTVASSYSTAVTTATSRQPYRQTAQKQVSRPRPKARRPQARLVALTQPQTTPDPQTPSTHHTDLVPSPAGSHTPTTSPVPPSPSSPPPFLPYNMKPAQLRWQKDVTYDSSGKIVDMLRLNPSAFPSHRFTIIVLVISFP